MTQQHRPPLHDTREAYVNVTGATYTAKGGDSLIGVNRAGVVTVTLPTAQVRPGRVYIIKDESGAAATYNITVATEGAETIDGAATDVMATNYGAKHYYSDGSNWFEVPVIAAAAIAHSATTGQTVSDHHTKYTDAEALVIAKTAPLDTLAAPTDITTLDFSTALHGLVPKGTNVGDFLKDDGTWATVTTTGAITREGGQTTESSGTNTAAADLISATGLTIAQAEVTDYHFAARKSTGAAVAVSCGLKLNTTVVKEASNSGNKGTWRTGATNIVEFGSHRGWIPGRAGTNYDRMGIGASVSYGAGTTQDSSGGNSICEGADLVTAQITSITIRGISGNASTTLGTDELQVYSGASA